ncbi:MAG: sugar ABC transporter ATP-binding protein [Rhodoglobus sp.]
MDVAPVIEVVDARLRFAGDTALDGVDFRMFAGEVHSLMGENGAGKSTLIKAMTGALRLDSGTLRLEGAVVSFPTPAAAQRAGISTVYQEIDLLPNLSVAENIMLGREPRRFGFIDWKRMRSSAASALASLGIEIDPASPLGSHPLAVQQLVAIARAVSTELRVLVLDEPTSSLDQDEVAELFRVIRELKARGVAILFISHFLEQVYEICDRVTVLRNGELIGEYLTTELLRIDLVQKMLGREAVELDVLDARNVGGADLGEQQPIVSARGIGRQKGLLPTDLDVYEGEVLGLAGLLGSGRTELARLLSGIDRPDSGEITVDGVVKHFREPRRALRAGIAYASENRKTEGIIAELSVRDNISLALQAERGWLRRIGRARQDELSASWIEALDIRPADPERLAGLLSGGNQQKVMLARLLALAPRLIVLDEPTRGIDVGAKVEIQRLIADLAGTGMSVIFISAELEEVLRVGHRILVLRDREVVARLDPDTVTIEMLLAIVAKADGDE